MKLTAQDQQFLEAALLEDGALADVTTGALVAPDTKAEAQIIAKEEGLIAGHAAMRYVLQQLDPNLIYEITTEDGQRASAGQSIVTIKGLLSAILRAERVGLNVLQRLSGIATTTAYLKSKIANDSVELLDTRKTTPNFRAFERYAVVTGGGVNHRWNLSDQILIKENHISALQAELSLPRLQALRECLRRCRQTGRVVEVEVENEDEARIAVEEQADIVLLDNMSPAQMQAIVEQYAQHKQKPLWEASGGISAETIAAVAATGVNRISMGALTHSVKSLDLSLMVHLEKKA